MNILYKSTIENHSNFNAVLLNSLDEIKSCPIRGLGLLINGKIYKSVGLSSDNPKNLVVEQMLLIEYIQANTRHQMEKKTSKAKHQFLVS